MGNNGGFLMVKKIVCKWLLIIICNVLCVLIRNLLFERLLRGLKVRIIEK